jgi:hypothetical protein
MDGSVEVFASPDFQNTAGYSDQSLDPSDQSYITNAGSERALTPTQLPSIDSFALSNITIEVDPDVNPFEVVIPDEDM